jgi:hypothetical protein
MSPALAVAELTVRAFESTLFKLLENLDYD